jgi:FtsZ-binding cell division protein ZapB
MTHPETQLKRVHEKFQQLVKLHQVLQKENEKLKEDSKKMSARCEALSLEAEKFRQQSEILKLSGNGLDEQEKKDLEKRLNQYVREIDRCIALLHE